MINQRIILIACAFILVTACSLETLTQQKLGIKTPEVTQSTPPDINLDDHQACLKKGFRLSVMEDPLTQKYYKCRAKFLKQKTTQSQSIFSKLSPAQKQLRKMQEEELKHFEQKAEAAYKAQIRVRDQARASWEESETRKLDRYEEQDNNACQQKGYFRGKPENPLTEAYYDCRAVEAGKKITPPPPVTRYPPTQQPIAVQEFYRKADQSKEAFNARDYQDHYSCMDKGLFPGKFHNPKTSKYLDCRADLATTGLGHMVADLFKEDASSARKEAEEHSACSIRHYKKGRKTYKLCRNAYIEYKSCKQNIDPQMAQRKSRNRRDCVEKSLLEYPTYLSRSNTKVLVKVDDAGEEIRSTAIESAKYTTGERTKARSGATSICQNERQSDLEQFKLQLGYKCEQIMTSLPQP